MRDLDHLQRMAAGYGPAIDAYAGWIRIARLRRNCKPTLAN
jgi:hypothetical protein